MFFKCAANGAEIGFTAFLAVFVFLLCCAVVLVLIGLMTRVFMVEDEE